MSQQPKHVPSWQAAAFSSLVLAIIVSAVILVGYRDVLTATIGFFLGAIAGLALYAGRVRQLGRHHQDVEKD